jgi:sensor histidine kinase YesM
MFLKYKAMNSKEINKFITRQLIELAIVLVFSVFITYAFSGNYLFSHFSNTYKNLLFGFCIGYSLWKGNQFIGFIGNNYFPWEKNPKLTLIVSSTLSVTFSIIDIFLVYYLYLNFVFNIDITDNLIRWIWQMVIVLLISLIITISYYLSYFFKWWRIATVNEEKLKQEAIQLRYDALKSNVNPHFLFNSLSVLTSLVDTDTQKAKEFIQQFSNIYRYVLEQRDRDIVPLVEEISFIKSFTDLHLIRHGNTLKVSIEVNDLSGYIIPLSLQILLENCFKHNIISEEKPLKVRVWRDGDNIFVQNNLQKRNTIHESGGVGLETISKQFEYFSDRKVEIIQTATQYTVKLPILNNIK